MRTYLNRVANFYCVFAAVYYLVSLVQTWLFFKRSSAAVAAPRIAPAVLPACNVCGVPCLPGGICACGPCIYCNQVGLCSCPTGFAGL